MLMEVSLEMLFLLFLQRLSSDCEDQIRIILQESALDYRLDPQLRMHCSEEVLTLLHANARPGILPFFPVDSSSPLSFSRFYFF